MSKSIRLIILSPFTAIDAALAAAAATLAADDGKAPDVHTLMTADDYTASGLDKLSEEERRHLSDWVERYREGAVTGPEVVKKPSEMTEEELAEFKEQRERELVAKVIPEFRGWSGKTVFELDNGQVWRQRQPGNMKYSGSDPTVVIRQNWLGKYVIEHRETGRAIGVKRID